MAARKGFGVRLDQPGRRVNGGKATDIETCEPALSLSLSLSLSLFVCRAAPIACSPTARVVCRAGM